MKEQYDRQRFSKLLSKLSRKAPSDKDGKIVRGKRVYKCAHGVEIKSRSKDERRPF